MQKNLQALVVDSLDDLKAQNVVTMDVAGISDVMDHMIIATGTSNRHVKSLANNLVVDAKNNDHQPIGVEGLNDGEWVLVDFGDTVVHIMQQTTRDFYELEKLWAMAPPGKVQNTN